MYWKADDADDDLERERGRESLAAICMSTFQQTCPRKFSFFFSFCFFVSPRGDFLLHDSQDRARILVISLETETVFCQVVGCNLYELVGEAGYASVSLLSYIQLAVCCSPTLAVCARLTDVV